MIIHHSTNTPLQHNLYHLRLHSRLHLLAQTPQRRQRLTMRLAHQIRKPLRILHHQLFLKSPPFPHILSLQQTRVTVLLRNHQHSLANS